MKVSQRFDRLRVTFEGVEVQLLTGLLDELMTQLTFDVTDEDPVFQRLFPSGYRDDPKAEYEFRVLTESALRGERVERIEACAGELAAGSGTETVLELTDADVSRRWIQVLNDLRLSLGTRLEIGEDEPEFDPDAADAHPRAVYYWLTALQDSVVTALMK